MLRKKTIGLIIFKKQGPAIRYLLLHHGGDYWNFPKGRPEAGEAERETALRELREETGIGEVKVIDGFLDGYDYDFDTKIENGEKQQINKTAIFFLGEVGETAVEVSHEHLDFGWFDYETALKRLFYQNGRDLLKRVHKFIVAGQEIVL
ncbi:MAG: hypothetical protein A2663_03065 [Candidatus Buchananbacteria bacterium RIFCSPHIGHO2_01_FULL_46_12]|uniref:Bis(5'-nucleosyl)-tetraphosphatase [asymmetrical] n=1 Tax=Candidatus Buchananbacteria bacterium RIFCSPHIGHO2_01_FULL_46_12 TaxID=1797536 RepID=A0A1G1Y8B3_9BACT|nr:MAG: hypothetical protein A2663_03065 [Candidatus Buchananbacteria bacterium RIFCSPHIGHO2_01_FULL_46_12]